MSMVYFLLVGLVRFHTLLFYGLLRFDVVIFDLMTATIGAEKRGNRVA